MYVAIDMDRQVFLHKHHDHETVSSLSWLECGQLTSTRIDNIESENFLRGVAHGDLCHLYKNVTGDDYREGQWGQRADQFRERLREAARNLSVTVALTDEVMAQVALVDDRLHSGERFKYALGSREPAQPQELFPMTPVPLAPNQLAAADQRAAEIARLRAEAEAESRQGQPEPVQPDDEDAPPPPPAPKQTKARAGSVQPVVFAACRKAWDERSPATTWAEVKAILAEQLILDGYHPTTVRIKLNKWAKENEITA